MIEQDVSKIQRNLTALVEFSRMVNSSHDLEFTLNNLLFSCLGKFLTPKGFVAVCRQGEITIQAFKGVDEKIFEEFPAEGCSEKPLEDEKVEAFLDKYNFTMSEHLVTSSKTLGFVSLGERINKQPFTEDEREFLKTILNIAATGIQNSIFINELKQVNRDLDGRITRLNSLFELSKEFSVLTEESRISKIFLFSLLGHFLVSNYALLYQTDKKVRVLESTLPKSRLQETFGDFDFSCIEDHMYADEIAGKYPQLGEFAFELLVPMKLQSDTKGLVLLGRRMNGIPYNESDVEFIYSLGGLAISSLENKRLFTEALEKQRMEEELELAKDIQKNLLPKQIPDFEGFDIAASSISSRQVGGDYYDIIQKSDKSFYIAVGDVSGKGVPASLLMANLQAFLKSICKTDLPMDEATAQVNDLVSENTSDGKFITFFWTLFDIQAKKMQYVNAGHNPTLLIRDGRIEYLDKGGLIFGVMKTQMPYQTGEVDLKSGDVVVMFTDGVTEAMNKDNEEFSDERFEEIVLENYESSSTEIMKKVKEDLTNFTQGMPQSDDITLIIVKVK